MRIIILTFFVITSIISCTIETKGNADRFKYGTFEIPAINNYSKTTIVRKDSLQLEYYSKKVTVSTDSTVVEQEIKKVDSLYIKWKNNFAYQLQIINPKTDLEKETIFVQITKVQDSSYEFSARVGYSKFKQKGTLYIAKK